MWEYVKGSEADFEGAPDWATLRTADLSDDTVNFFVERHDKGAKYRAVHSDWTGAIDNDFLDYYSIPVIAERRKLDSLQSRVNDANLQQAFDTVQRPVHYNQSGIECIDAIAASMTPAEFQAYLKGNVQKYLWRYQHKNGVEDCRKAQWYLDRLVKELSK